MDLVYRPEVQTLVFYVGVGTSIYWLSQQLRGFLVAIWIYIFRPIFARRRNWQLDFGEWAVVTGASDGLGKEFARQLASQGMNVVIMSRSLDKLTRVADEIIRDFPVKVKVIPINFSQATLSTYQALEKELRDLDLEIGLLVNNVGVYVPYPKPFGETDYETLWDHVSVNVGAATMMTRILLPQMKERKRGGIINISSAAALIPMPMVSTYSASKIYMDYLSESLRLEYGEWGIKTMNLNPLFISTNMTQFNEKIGKPSFFVPTAEKVVANALLNFGVVDSAVGYLTHALQYGGIQLLPRKIFTWIVHEKYKELKKEAEEDKKKI